MKTITMTWPLADFLTIREALEISAAEMRGAAMDSEDGAQAEGLRALASELERISDSMAEAYQAHAAERLDEVERKITGEDL